jgi:integrase
VETKNNRRLQRGCVTKHRNSWLGLWRENGHRRSTILGKRSQLSKSEARAKLAGLLSTRPVSTGPVTLGAFLASTFFPLYVRTWKESTRGTSMNRIASHIGKEYGARALESITREELQLFLDAKAAAKLSYSVVRHLRWDLRQIFRLALADGLINKNPGEVLVIPKCHRSNVRTMSTSEVRLLLSSLQVPHLLIAKLATIAGMRPGEIFALQWKHIQPGRILVEQRIYQRKLDSPKSFKSRREAAITKSTEHLLDLWRSNLPSSDPDDWVFPSENLDMPLDSWNERRRSMGPALAKIGLGWVDFQVMRRTHSSLMSERKTDPKWTADQLGHTVDVDLNVYAQTSAEVRVSALEALEAEIEGSGTTQ